MRRTLRPAILGRAVRLAIPVVAMWAAIGAWAGDAAGKSKSELTFERLTALVGEWEGVQSGTEFQVTYTLTADGSALMEEFRPRNGAAMVTVFTVDGDQLIATHYCSARNQPQMITEEIADPYSKNVAFSLVRVTGLKTPDDWHNTGLVLILEDRDHLTQEWTYHYKGETGKTFFHLTRAGDASLPTVEIFQKTEQALMVALAGGERSVWDRVMDPDCVITSEEGEVVTKARFLDDMRPLPEGLSGSIAVKDLSVQRPQDVADVAVVRYLADESETVFGQRLSVQYRVTNTYRRAGPEWKLLASHLSVVTRDPPAQDVSRAGWPGLVGRYRLSPYGWTLTVELKDGELYAGRDPAKLHRLIPLAPDAFVLTGSLGEWIFVVENGRASRVVNLRKFAVLVWTRVEETH